MKMTLPILPVFIIFVTIESIVHCIKYIFSSKYRKKILDELREE